MCPYLVFAARTPASQHTDTEFIVGNAFTDTDIARRLDDYRFHDRHQVGTNSTCGSCSMSSGCGKGCPAAVVASGGRIGDGEPLCSIGLTDDLDDDLRANVLAFGLAVLVGTLDILDESPDGVLGISRQRLPQADNGLGNLAWHMLQTCGRESPSTTFRPMIIQPND